MLEVNLSKEWQDGKAPFQLALQFEVGQGEIMGIMGPSGTGKTTLLHLIAGLIKPDKGFISLRDEKWFEAETNIFQPPQKRKVAYVFQEGGLFPHMTLRQNLQFAMSTPKDISDELHQMGLGELVNRYPHQLSGGQYQRGALLRAILQQPNVLLMDEPFSALDTDTRHQMQELLLDWVRPLQLPVLIASHDPKEILNLADRMVYVSEGKIIQAGKPQDILLANETQWLKGKVIGAHDGKLMVQVGMQKIQIFEELPVPIGQWIQIDYTSGTYQMIETPRESEDS